LMRLHHGTTAVTRPMRVFGIFFILAVLYENPRYV
jgi:hypothetical protein